VVLVIYLLHRGGYELLTWSYWHHSQNNGLIEFFVEASLSLVGAKRRRRRF